MCVIKVIIKENREKGEGDNSIIDILNEMSYMKHSKDYL